MEAARIRGTNRNSKTFIIIVMNGDKLMEINIISIVIFLKVNSVEIQVLKVSFCRDIMLILNLLRWWEQGAWKKVWKMD